jgi:hypothetical protein
MRRVTAPILLALALALGACGDEVDDVRSSLEKVATDVRDWAKEHSDWKQILESAKDSDVAKLAEEQVQSMRKAAEDIADDVKSIDDEDVKKRLEQMRKAVDDLQGEAQNVVDALKNKGDDAYARALVEYQKVADEAVKRQKEVTELVEEKLNEKQ